MASTSLPPSTVSVATHLSPGPIYTKNNQSHHRNSTDKDSCSEGVELTEFITKILENTESFLGVRFLGLVIFVYC